MLSPSRWSLGRPLVRLASSTVSASRSRNLTEHYRRLENTTKAKSERPTLSQISASATAQQPNGSVRAGTPTSPDTIAGFVIPQEPLAPADDECCMSGCAVCVYDLYEEALVAYKDSVMTLRNALSARHIPETEWPVHIRTGNASHTPPPTATERSKGAVLDAFEEMERALKEKREKRASVEAEKKARGDVLVGDGEQVGVGLRGVYEGIRWVIFPNR